MRENCNSIEGLKKLFFEKYGEIPEITRITGGGSPRQYYRMKTDRISVVGVIGEEVKENKTFLELDDCLKQSRINVPDIISISSDLKSYLLEDLGDISLFSLLNAEGKMKLSKKALSDLVKIQSLPEKLWEGKVGHNPFSERLVKWDLNYFKYDFLKPAGIEFDEEKLEDDFERMVKELSPSNMIHGFMYRDFQSRNIMVKDHKFWFIDFQGARKGPVVYDAVSFIWQAKAPFSFAEREDLGEYYAREWAKLGVKEENIISQMKPMMVFRTLQVLGAYGFRGLIEKKSHFIESLPYAVSNLKYLKEKRRTVNYPEIERIIDRLVDKYLGGREKQEDVLTLRVFSFSYKKGYPEDKSGNGGGFMFDCRAIHNPGRYEEYKKLTGKDKEVIEFLEKTDEASSFVRHAINIVSPSVERYLKRGFTSLVVGFGCTGGQHRSVYCAEEFGKQISQMFPRINVIIKHREQEF